MNRSLCIRLKLLKQTYIFKKTKMIGSPSLLLVKLFKLSQRAMMLIATKILVIMRRRKKVLKCQIITNLKY